MCNRRLARRLLCLIYLCCFLPGCQVFVTDPPLTVLVRDAETKKPIPSAEVYLCQRLKNDEIAPCRSRDLTQPNGMARLRAEAAGPLGLQVQAVAQGYLPDKVMVPADALKKKPAPSPSPRAEQRPADVIVEVYAEPNFTVELVLPPGYRGLVKAEIQREDNVAVSSGQRCFRYAVPPTGEVFVKGPSLLQRVPASEYRARYADGPLLGTTLDAVKVGFRWIKGAGNRQYFVVGNQVDYEALHRRLAPESIQTAASSWDDAPRPHKYRYGKITAKNYEKD